MAEKQDRGQNVSEAENAELERKNLNKSKILEGMTAYVISLILFACAYGFLTDIIGIWALYAACALSVLSVILLIKITRLKFSSVLKFSFPKIRDAVGCSLILASAFLLSMPLILFSHILAPSLALTSFNIYSTVNEKDGVFIVILLVLLISICENLLFDGYIYSRFSSLKSPFLKAAATALMASVLRLDLYALTTVFIMSFACFILRRESGSMTLSLVVRLFSTSFVMAMTNVSATSTTLVGEAMGVLQVTGLSLIFVGMAIPATVGALAAFGKLHRNGKIIGFLSAVAAIVFVAVGCGISSL